MNRHRWVVPVVAGLLVVVAAAWASASQPADSPPVAPQEVAVSAVATLTPVADAYVDWFQPETRFGTAQTLQVQDYQGRESTRRTLLRFDLSQIPANSTIESAVLRMYLVSAVSDITDISLRFTPITSA